MSHASHDKAAGRSKAGKMDQNKICIVLVTDDLGYGGAERQVVELANNLNRTRFDVHVCVLSDHIPLSSTLVDTEHRLHIVKKENKFDLSVVPRLARLLKELKADIVHGYLFSAEIASRLAGRIAGTKLVIGSERNANHGIKRRHVLTYRFTQRCVDAIVANSRAGAEWNARVFNRPASDYRVVHNGVDIERFVPADMAILRRRLGLREDCCVIGNVSNFKPQKNHTMLFRAFKLVLGSFPDAQLLLAGDQPVDSGGRHNGYQGQCNCVIDDLGIRQQCVFLGHQDAMEYLYPACDLTVLSSLHEGTPNVLLESMACGVPVIATRVCDNAYVVKEGQVGYLVDVGDEKAMADRINELLGDATLRRQMGRRAREWVLDEFSTMRLAEKMAKVYTELLTKPDDGHV